MQVLQGSVNECRYRRIEDGKDNALVCTQDVTATEGDLVFIEDSLGLHKVGNPHPTQPAFTLHLYSPPFQQCKVWLDETHCSSTKCYNYSEYGKKL